MDRRAFLTRTLAAASVGALAGWSFFADTPEPGEETPKRTETPKPTDTEPTAIPGTDEERESMTRHGITFDAVLHAVDDLGMDPAGSRPIDAELDRAYGSGTIIVFPPGKYLIRQTHKWKENASGFGMLGLGETKRDVQFVFPKGNRGAPDPENYWFLRVENGRDHLLENVTIQQTDDKVTGVGMLFRQEDGLHIHDVELAGFNPSWYHDPGFGIIAALTSRSGIGVIEGFTCADGGVVDLYPKRKIPIAAYRNHVGELRILDAHIANSGEHSMYVSRNRGCVRVENGLFVNNDNTNLRMSGGGHPTKRSWAKNCRIVIDTKNATNLPDGERYQGARGIWVESGGQHKYGHTDLLLENIRVDARSNARPATLLLHEHSHGALTVRNCSFRSKVDGATVIDSRYPFTKWVQRPYGLSLQDTFVSTTANRTSSGYAVHLNRRPDSSIENSKIELVAGDVNGILIKKSDGTRLLNTEITTRPPVNLGHISSESLNIEIGENDGIVVQNTADYSIQNVRSRVPGQEVRVKQSPSDDSVTSNR